MKVNPVENELINNMSVNLLDFTNIADSQRQTAVDRCGTGYVIGEKEFRSYIETTRPKYKYKYKYSGMSVNNYKH